MSEHDEKFTLENLDHLSEEFAQSDSSLPEVRLLQDLQRAQKAQDRIVTHATERVWQRLLASEHLKETAERDMHSTAPMSFQSHTKNTRKGISTMNNFSKLGALSERRGHRLLAEVAAVLLVGVLVSMFAILTQFYHTYTGHSATEPPITKQGVQTTSAPAFLYMTGQQGIVKLDKQSGKVLWTFRAPDWKQLQLLSLFPQLSSITTKIITSTENTVYVTNSATSTSATKTSTFTLHEYAINAQNGALRWSYTSQGDEAAGDPVLAGNTLYLAVKTGVTVQVTGSGSSAITNAIESSLLALDTRNGHLLWRTQLKGVGGESLAVKNGLVYASITNGGLNRTSIYGVEAVQAQSGTPAWSTLTPGSALSQSAFQVTNTLVYDITMEADKNITIVHAFDALNGKEHWSSPPMAGVEISGVTPVLSNGVLYFCASFGREGDTTGKIFALDAASGRQLQVHSLPLELYELLPVDGHIYLAYTSHGGPDPSTYQTYGSAGLLALDGTTYHRLWLDSNINGDMAFPSSLLLENGLLYFLAANQVEAANPATGKIVWQQDLSQYMNFL
jgi:hypothetical protein